MATTNITENHVFLRTYELINIFKRLMFMATW